MLRYMLIVSIVSIPMSVYTMDLSDLSSNPLVRRMRRASINAEYQGNAELPISEAVKLQKRKEFMARIKEFMPDTKLTSPLKRKISGTILLMAFFLFRTGLSTVDHLGNSIGHFIDGDTGDAWRYARGTLLGILGIAIILAQMRKPEVACMQEVEKFKTIAQEYGISAQLAEGFLTCPAFIECYEQQLQMIEDMNH